MLSALLLVASSAFVFPSFSSRRLQSQRAVFDTYDSTAVGLPRLLIFPGIDGTGKVGVANCDRLANYFDVRVLRLGEADRSTHEEIVALSIDELTEGTILVGESMGGVSALAVALAKPDMVSAVVLGNPATSYGRAPLSAVAPLLPRIPGPLYEALPALVTPLFGKPGWFDGMLSDAVARNPVDDILRRSYALSSALTPGALEWRERELVRRGARIVNDELERITAVPRWASSSVFIGGGRDFVLPSTDECRRLSRLLGGLPKVVVEPEAAHVILDDLNLEDFLKLPQKRKRIVASSDTLEKKQEIILESQNDVERLIYLAKSIVSPVFFSTSDDGLVERGLDNVPSMATDDPERQPILFCGNHQLFGLDGPLIVEAFARERGVLLPSLAHPSLLEDVSPLDPLPYPLRGSAAMLRRFGSLPAGARQLIQALRGPAKAVLVFPGGGREVFKRKGEEYELKSWDPTLARIAAKFNATIVPFSAIGADDGIGTVLLDSDELLGLPVIGDFFKNRTQDLPSFVEGDVFVPPLLAPRIQGPKRMYFLFHKPIRGTAAFGEDPDLLQKDVQDAVESGIEKLLKARKSDPFQDNMLARLTYEAAVGKQAPSFEL